MRVVTWNMAAGFAFDSARHERAWHYLRALDPDVALLQETVPPAWAHEHWSILAHRKYAPSSRFGGVPWGSAIVAKNRVLTEHELDETTPWLRELRGCVVVARLEDENPCWLASIHSNAYPLSAERLNLFHANGLRRCDDTAVWEVELVAADLERLVSDQRSVIGGDLNSALLFDTAYGGNSNARLFSNLREAGFHDLRTGEEEQQTFFRKGNRPYQLDHVFADGASASATQTWRVLPEVARDLQLSDHAPIEVSLRWPVEASSSIPWSP